MAKDTVQFLSVKVLQPNPFQPRGKVKDEDIAELADSIKRHGLLEPLVVAQTPAGYQIIAGERRWRASKAAGLDEVPVLIKKTSPRGMLEMALIENVQRVDLNPIERAQAFTQLQRDFKLEVGQIAERISKSSSYISNSLKLLRLPDAIKDGVVGGQITEGHARAISGIDDKKLMVDVYKQILRENASVRRAEDLARLYKAKSGQDVSYNEEGKKILPVDAKQVSDWEDKISKLIEARAKLKVSRSRNFTRVTITIRGNPQETQEELERLMDLTTKDS